jgi:hypothetical protein
VTDIDLVRTTRAGSQHTPGGCQALLTELSATNVTHCLRGRLADRLPAVRPTDDLKTNEQWETLT